MSSVSEAASFAFSGAIAKALASVLAESVLTNASSPPAKTPSKIDPSPPAPPPAQPCAPLKTRVSVSDFYQHIDSAIFFLVLAVASTRIAKFHGEHCSTAREAAEAFVSGAAAGVCMRLVSDVLFHKEKQKKTAAGQAAGTRSSPLRDSGDSSRAPGDWRRRLAARFTWRNMEEDVVLAMDPALTSCLYKILDKLAVGRAAFAAAAAGNSARQSKSKSLADHTEIAATMFVVAALSKAIAATVTYPLQTAKQHRERQAEEEADEERVANGTANGMKIKGSSGKSPWQDRGMAKDRARGKAREDGITANSRLLSVLWRFAMVRGLLALYTGWLPAVALASVSHGMTKVGQDLLGGLFKRLAAALVSALGAWGFVALPPSRSPDPRVSRPPPSSSMQRALDLHQQQQGQQQQRQLRRRLVEQEWLPAELRRVDLLSWSQNDRAHRISASTSPLYLPTYRPPDDLPYRPPSADWERPSPMVLLPTEKQRLSQGVGRGP